MGSKGLHSPASMALLAQPTAGCLLPAAFAGSSGASALLTLYGIDRSFGFSLLDRLPSWELHVRMPAPLHMLYPPRPSFEMDSEAAMLL